MRIPRLRLRLWWLMALVALIGVALGVGISLRDRRQRFQQLSDDQYEATDRYPRALGSVIFHEDATCAVFLERGYPPSEGGKHEHPLSGLISDHDRRWLRYHFEMGARYRLAAAAPWRPVGADPDPPAGSDRPDSRSGR